MVMSHVSLYEDKAIWIKLEGIEGGNIEIACVDAPNIPIECMHLWHFIMDSLPKRLQEVHLWGGGDFSMIKCCKGKSNDCGWTMNELECYNWNKLLNTLQVQDSFICQCHPRLSWNSGQVGRARRLARLRRFYTSKNQGLDFHLKEHYIHGYPVGCDHSMIPIEVTIRTYGGRNTSFKWTILHLNDEIIDELRMPWDPIC